MSKTKKKQKNCNKARKTENGNRNDMITRKTSYLPTCTNHNTQHIFKCCTENSDKASFHFICTLFSEYMYSIHTGQWDEAQHMKTLWWFFFFFRRSNDEYTPWIFHIFMYLVQVFNNTNTIQSLMNQASICVRLSVSIFVVLWCILCKLNGLLKYVTLKPNMSWILSKSNNTFRENLSFFFNVGLTF